MPLPPTTTSIICDHENSLQQHSPAATSSTVCGLEDFPQKISPKTTSRDCYHEECPCKDADRFPNSEFYKENFHRMEDEQDAYEGFHVNKWDIGPIGAFLNGPIVPAFELNDKYIRAAACAALESYNKREGTSLELAKIVKANWIYVGGQIYYITLEADDGLFYETKVCCWCLNSKIDYDVIVIRSAKHYPMKDSP